MADFLQQNLATILLSLVFAVLLFLAIRRIIKKGTCGGDCGGGCSGCGGCSGNCPHACQCHLSQKAGDHQAGKTNRLIQRKE